MLKNAEFSKCNSWHDYCKYNDAVRKKVHMDPKTLIWMGG